MTTTTAAQYDNIIFNAVKGMVPETVAKLLVQQARHESGNYTSNVFKKNNNAYGMKMPSKRKSPYILAAGSSAPANEGATPYARYRNVGDSAKDVVHWLNYNKIDLTKIQSASEYANILKSKGYYGASITEYVNGLLNAAKKIDWVTTMKAASSGLAVFVIAAITVFF